MPVYALSKDLAFPPVEAAEPDGLLAVGGDLSAERLVLAYREGIFPWYDAGGPLLWWSPDPRFVLFPDRLKVSKSMTRVLKQPHWTVTWDRDFAGVIRNCKSIPRRDQPGTWITPAMQKAYIRLHELGYAHSVEVWRERELVGGLYGVSLGGAFFGESMFARASNASKVALVALARGLQRAGFHFIDCQIHTEHLESLGAEPLPRKDFIARLRVALRNETRLGSWADMG